MAVVVGATLLGGPPLQAEAEFLIGAGQEDHKVRGANLGGWEKRVSGGDGDYGGSTGTEASRAQ